MCENLSRSFDSGVIKISHWRLLPHEMVSLGFFLSRSHRKWNVLNLSDCRIGDHGMSILHQYLCGDKANKQEITEIDLGNIGLTGASSHPIADIISHFQTHTIKLHDNNITNVRDISTAVVTTSTVKVLNMRSNDLTAQEAVALSDMMICLEKLCIGDNKLGDYGAELLSEGITNTKTLRKLYINNNNIGPSGTATIANALTNNTSLETLWINDNKLGDHGAELLSEGITNTKTLKVLLITRNNIGPSGTTIIANALTSNTSLEVMYMHGNVIGQDGAKAIARAITNNKTLKKLSLGGKVNKSSLMMIMRSLHSNNTVTELRLGIDYKVYNDDTVQKQVIKINNKRNKCDVQELRLVWLS